MTVYLLNTTVVPCEGLWDVRKTELSYARYLAEAGFLKSAIGHESTASLLSSLLGTAIQVNRVAVVPALGDKLLCFKLKGRAPEGKILSVEELQEMGYEFFMMELVSRSKRDYWSQAQKELRDSQLWESRIKRTESRDCLGGHRD
jgi:hypothetical protein